MARLWAVPRTGRDTYLVPAVCAAYFSLTTGRHTRRHRARRGGQPGARATRDAGAVTGYPEPSAPPQNAIHVGRTATGSAVGIGWDLACVCVLCSSLITLSSVCPVMTHVCTHAVKKIRSISFLGGNMGKDFNNSFITLRSKKVRSLRSWAPRDKD